MKDLGTQVLEKPDLYNPVWINVTLAFCLIVSTNIIQYFSSPGNSAYKFDFKAVGKAFSIVFGFAFFLPAILVLLFYISSSPLGLKKIIGMLSLYSYSNIFYIVATVLSLIPLKTVSWIAFLLSSLVIVFFLNVNFYHFTYTLSELNKKITFGFLAVLSLFAGLCYKLNFF